MPTPALQSFAKRANVPIETAETKWDEAKKEVDQGLKTKDPKQYWARVMWLTQKKLGLKEERLTFKEYADIELAYGPPEAPAVEPTPEPAPAEAPQPVDPMVMLTAELSCFMGALFLGRDIAHKFHLETTSFAQHEALKELYDLLVDRADKFAEVGMGITGFPLNLCVPAESRGWSQVDAVSFIRSMVSDLENCHGPCFKQNGVLDNMMHELLADVYRIKYKLERLS